MGIIKKFGLLISGSRTVERRSPIEVFDDIERLLADERKISDERVRNLFWEAHGNITALYAEKFLHLSESDDLANYFAGLNKIENGMGDTDCAAFHWLFGEFSAVSEAVSLLDITNRGRDSADCLRALILNRSKSNAANTTGETFDEQRKSYLYALAKFGLSPLT